MLFLKRLNVERVKGYILVNYCFLLTFSISFCFHDFLKFILVFFSEMLDGCRALLSIATVTTPSVFDQLLKSTRSVVEFLIIGCLVIIYIKVIVMMAFPVPCYLV